MKVQRFAFLLLVSLALHSLFLNAKPNPTFVIRLADGEDEHQVSANITFRDNGNLFVGKQVTGIKGARVYRVDEYDGATGKKVRSKEIVQIAATGRAACSMEVAGKFLYYVELNASDGFRWGTALLRAFNGATLEELGSRQGLPYAEEDPFLLGVEPDGRIFFEVDNSVKGQERLVRVFALDPNDLTRLALDTTEAMPADPPPDYYIADNGDIWWTKQGDGYIARYDHTSKQRLDPSIPIDLGTDIDEVRCLLSGCITLTDETRTKGKHRGRAYRYSRDDGREINRRDFSGCAFLHGSYVALSSDRRILVPRCVQYRTKATRRVPVSGGIHLDLEMTGVKIPTDARLIAIDAETLDPVLDIPKSLKRDPRFDYVVWHGAGETRLAYVGAEDFSRIEVYRVGHRP